jgi:hypothetical protein
MRILNPSGFHKNPSSAGLEYDFPPFSIVHVWDEQDAKHIVRSQKEFGLVSIEPNEGEREQFKGNPNAFMQKQALAGLKELLKRYTQALTDEMQAERDSKDKTGTEVDRRIINVKKFEENVKLIEKWISEVSAPKWSPAKYLKNENRRQNESWDYTDESSAKAG